MIIICFFVVFLSYIFFFSSRRRHTRCALVTGVQTCALPICPTRARARLQTRHALVVVAMHPVAQGLTIHAAEPRRLGPRMAFENQRQSQQAADLSPVAASAAERTKLRARVLPSRDLPPRAHQSRPHSITRQRVV